MTAADEARKAIQRAVDRQAAQQQAMRSLRTEKQSAETDVETPDRDRDEQ